MLTVESIRELFGQQFEEFREQYGGVLQDHEKRMDQRIESLRVQQETGSNEQGQECLVDVDSQEEVDAAAGDAIPHVGQRRGLGSYGESGTRSVFRLKPLKTNPPNFLRMRRIISCEEMSFLLTPSAVDVRKHWNSYNQSSYRMQPQHYNHLRISVSRETI